MKKLTKKSLLLLGLLTTMFTYANGEPKVESEKETKVTSISFDKVKKGSMLSIRDTKGIVLYKEPIVKSGDYSKGFDLTSLPNGDYYFELDKELEILVIPFNVVSNQVAFKKEGKSRIFKPFIRVKDEMVYVSRTSLDKSPIEYSIYYVDNYDLVLKEKENTDTYMRKVYDFSKAKKGEYVFVFKYNGRTHSKTVKI